MARAADNPSDMNRAVATSWVDALLGADRHQRVRVKQSLVASLVYLGLSAICTLGVWLGVIDAVQAGALVAAVLGASAVFYALIRSGFNQRFASDPALTQAQGVVCVLASCAAYVVAGPIRGAMLMTIMIGQVFGIFALTPRQARRMAAIGVLTLGATMGACAYFDPVHFAPREELLQFLLVALML